MIKVVENKKRKHLSATLIILCVILAIYTVILIVPLLWALYTSFVDYKIYDFGTVRKDLYMLLGFQRLKDGSFKSWFTIQNIVTAFTDFKVDMAGGVHITEMFLYSVLYSGGCAIIATIVPCVMAYLVARFNYVFGKIVYAVVLVTMAIPIVGALPSEIKMIDNLGLTDSLFALFVLKANFLGIYFLVFHAQFKGIPKDYTEAAELDGASDFKVMLGIIFPISIGTITTVMLLNFISFWNDYQIPMIYWPSHPVMAYGMYYFVRYKHGQEGQGSTPVSVAAMIMVAIPILILFAFFNKKIMSNMSIGGVKG
ncbi:MAG: carbohydrate ABC transporter permease [Clostridia bacterium]|nr:carbohydrate ABC transporter permease [Clostridia bacterium]